MKTIIYGTGSLGEKIYYKISNSREIIGFCDSNNQKWHQNFLGKLIYSPEEISKMKDVDIVIASTYYAEIMKKLLEKKIEKKKIYYVNPKSFLIQRLEVFLEKKSKRRIKRILFVQAVPGIRIDKVALVLKERGIKSDVAYLITPPQLALGLRENPYDKIIAINDLQEFITYVDSEDYDLVFSANGPDYLSVFLLNSNKCVVHDTADMMSLRGDVSIEEMVCEYVANKKSKANIYVTELVKEIAMEKFNIFNKKLFVLNNYVLKKEKPSHYLKKLSLSDSEIHCVYEGGIVADETHHRYYENLFLKLAKNQIHVHFYGKCQSDTGYCDRLAEKSPYIHYEGCLSYEELQNELTKYDVGLVLLNITERNNQFLQTTFPNKIFEYLYAGLPVAVSKIEALIQFVQEYGVGRCLDFNGNIRGQLEEIKKINIEQNFLEDNKLTMDDQAEKIITFLEDVVNNG